MVARFPLWCPPVTSTVLPVIIFFVISCMMEWNCTVKKNEVKWNGTNSWLTKYKNNVRVVQYSSTPVLLHWSTKNERAEYWRQEEISWDFKLKKNKDWVGAQSLCNKVQVKEWYMDTWFYEAWVLYCSGVLFFIRIFVLGEYYSTWPEGSFVIHG